MRHSENRSEELLQFHQYDNHCQFVDCQHINEPGCAVKGALDRGAIFKERYRNYLNIYSNRNSTPCE